MNLNSCLQSCSQKSFCLQKTYYQKGLEHYHRSLAFLSKALHLMNLSSCLQPCLFGYPYGLSDGFGMFRRQNFPLRDLKKTKTATLGPEPFLQGPRRALLDPEWQVRDLEQFSGRKTISIIFQSSRKNSDGANKKKTATMQTKTKQL